jgi:hypothetical protein
MAKDSQKDSKMVNMHKRLAMGSKETGMKKGGSVKDCGMMKKGGMTKKGK